MSRRYLNDEEMDFMYENYNCNINDLLGFIDEDECVDNMDYNIGNFEFILTDIEQNTILNDLNLSRSDIEVGYGRELLSGYINSGYIEQIALDNDILWDKSILGDKDYYTLKTGLKVYDGERDDKTRQRYVSCCCGEVRIIHGLNFQRDSYICPGCKRQHRSEMAVKSKGEDLIKNLLKSLDLDFQREVVEIGLYRFDFIVNYNSKKYYIEIHGEQHYRPIEYFGGEVGFLKRIKSDMIKKEHASKKGVYIELDYREHDLSLLKQRFEDQFVNKYIFNGGMK